MKNYELEYFLNNTLSVHSVPDIASNGLQVEGAEQINKIALGVSVSMEFLEQAKSYGANTVLVHHGLFWGRPLLIKSYIKDRINFILKNNMNLMAYHLPLDLHEEYGNNISIIRLLPDAYDIKPFGYYKGVPIGYSAKLKETKIENLKQTITNTLGLPLRFIKEHETVKTIAVVSGGAPELFEEAISKNIDLYITGEVAEYTQAIARETKTSYLALGHYNSEKLGVQSLGNLLMEKFNLESKFIDVPNVS